MKPRALVLGATGHIGAHVVRALVTQGYPVRAAYRTPRFLSVLQGLPVETVPVDLQEPQSLRRALAGCEWIFHAAGYYPRFGEHRDRALAQALASIRRVLDEFTGAAPARIVFTSSAATIQRVPGRLAMEADPEPWPLCSWRPLYATIKIMMEQEILRAAQAGVPIVVVNPSLCIGEYDAHLFSGRAILAFAKYRLPFYIPHQFNCIYTGDVGIGHVRAAERGRCGERYLLAVHNVTLKDFATLVATLSGVSPPRVRVPYRLALAGAVMSELVAKLTWTEPPLPREAVHTTRMGQRLDGSKAIRELGLPQTPLEEAIRRALGWFRQHGYL